MLDAASATTAIGTEIDQRPSNGGADQQWKLVPVGWPRAGGTRTHDPRIMIRRWRIARVGTR
jgi:hypothetical protein